MIFKTYPSALLKESRKRIVSPLYVGKYICYSSISRVWDSKWRRNSQSTYHQPILCLILWFFRTVLPFYSNPSQVSSVCPQFIPIFNTHMENKEERIKNKEIENFKNICWARSMERWLHLHSLLETARKQYICIINFLWEWFSLLNKSHSYLFLKYMKHFSHVGDNGVLPNW